jgi:hypothetical protein
MSIYESMTLGEIEEFETIAQIPIDEIGEPGTLKGKIYQALTFVWGKRTNPALTLIEVKAMTRNQADALLVVAEDPK